MNKREILEIKKTLTKDKTCIKSIAGCYVNAQKNKIITFVSSLNLLPEEEQFKYLRILKSCFSGKIGEKLLNLSFTNESEGPDTGHELLLNLKDSDLDNENTLNKVFDMIINTYPYEENYLILIANGAYDIPGNLADSSDYVYKHLVCAICPVKLSKEGLSYYSKENIIRNRDRDWVVGMPINGFLFPSFTNRNTDIHSMLYYSKSYKEANSSFINDFLNIKIPLFANEQKVMLDNAVMAAFDCDCNYETMVSVYENIKDIAFEHKDDEVPYNLSKNDFKTVLEKAGIKEDGINKFENYYENTIKRESIQPDNIVINSLLTIEIPNVKIKINRDYAESLKIENIKGKKCIVIDVNGDIKLDGVGIH